MTASAMALRQLNPYDPPTPRDTSVSIVNERCLSDSHARRKKGAADQHTTGVARRNCTTIPYVKPPRMGVMKNEGSTLASQCVMCRTIMIDKGSVKQNATTRRFFSVSISVSRLSARIFASQL